MSASNPSTVFSIHKLRSSGSFRLSQTTTGDHLHPSLRSLAVGMTWRSVLPWLRVSFYFKRITIREFDRCHTTSKPHATTHTQTHTLFSAKAQRYLSRLNVGIVHWAHSNTMCVMRVFSSASCFSLKGKRVGTSLVEANSSSAQQES